MTRSTRSFDIRKTCSILQTAAALVCLLPVAGCAMGMEEPGADYSKAQSNSKKFTGGAAGEAGNAGAAGDPTHAGSGGSSTGGSAGTGGTGGSAGTGGFSGNGGWAGSTPSCPDTCGSQETCGNYCDDDCDGAIDQGCELTCEETDGHNCNGDDGHGDRCDPSDNENGCSPEKFWAWCNRRNDAYPDIWDNYLRAWVVARCDGEVTLEDPNNDGYPTFICHDSKGRTWECSTPLVLSFDGSAVQYERSGHSFELMAGRADVSATHWPTAATPWLAMDRDGNGRIDDGSELFGSSTRLASGARARNGFEALAELDDNADGVIDSQDGSWCKLVAWSDRNNDGISQPGELTAVGELGLVAISLDNQVQARCDSNGNCERERSSFFWNNGAGLVRGTTIDIYLRMGAAH
ncbi:MAG: hypothetical protein HY898_20965 [Deltaproteobacteria bacterium]|nr:hypothetical protein [Deltaproteobacteria bacterium]